MLLFKQFFIEQTKLGQGSSRIVYDAGDNKVLKVAKNETGIVQNKEEANLKYQRYKAVPRVFEVSDDYKWIKSEKADPVGPNRLQQLLGIKDMNDLKTYLLIKKSNNTSLSSYTRKLVDLLDNNSNVQDITKLVFENNLVIADVCRLSSFGEINRDGKPYVVVIDYGLNEQDYAKHYTGKRDIRRQMHGY